MNPHLEYFVMNARPLVKKIIVLRDPYNWLASTIKSILNSKKKKPYEKDLRNLIARWKWHAEYFLRKDRGCFFVLFNRFVERDPSYRMTISDYIEEDFTDIGTNYISSMGSSFDKKRFQKCALDMKLNERWKEKEIIDQVRFFMDDELRKYSRLMSGIWSQ